MFCLHLEFSRFRPTMNMTKLGFFFYIQNQSGERKISLKVNFFIALVYWTNVNKNVARALFTKQMLWALHLANNSTTNYTKVWLIIRNTLLLNCKHWLGEKINKFIESAAGFFFFLDLPPLNQIVGRSSEEVMRKHLWWFVNYYV